MDALGIYIHIPFCLRKCAYCSFVSYPDRLYLMDSYIDALINEACLYKTVLKGRTVDTVFIGGGTPSLLSPAQIEKLIVSLKDMSVCDIAEMTIEANPETLDEEKLCAYAKLGINRISIGLQTHENAVLKDIGRGHTWESFLCAFESSSRYFENINVDTIFGLPDQTLKSVEETLKRLIALSPKHISAYALKLESGTPLIKRFCGAEEDTDRQMYHLIAQKLTEAGYLHYETSNFAKAGYECRHNLKYWTGEEYLGLGVAAYSFLKKEREHRFGNTPDIKEYFQSIKEHKRPISKREYLSETDRIVEYIMLRLRLRQGIFFEDYDLRFNKSFLNDFAVPIDTTKKAGLIRADDKGIYPTIKGFDLQNALIGEFIKKL